MIFSLCFFLQWSKQPEKNRLGAQDVQRQLGCWLIGLQLSYELRRLEAHLLEKQLGMSGRRVDLDDRREQYRLVLQNLLTSNVFFFCRGRAFCLSRRSNEQTSFTAGIRSQLTSTQSRKNGFSIKSEADSLPEPQSLRDRKAWPWDVHHS